MRLCIAIHRNIETERVQHLERLTEYCSKINKHLSVKECLELLGLDRLFPRVVHHLDAAPGAPKVDMGTSVAGYVVLLSCYNQVHELALLLHKDVLALNDHKYIAHQVVLLHQSVSKCGKALESFKCEIEQHFEDLKEEIEGFDEATTMTPETQAWFCNFLDRLTLHTLNCAAAAMSRLPCGRDLGTFLTRDLSTLK